MGHPYHHALSSVRRWGGAPEDYQAIHDWFDASKAITADFRHRALRHHAEGIFACEAMFGTTITLTTGRVVPVRLIGERHVVEDLGSIPSFSDWVRTIRPEPWMGRAQPIHLAVDPFAQGRAIGGGTAIDLVIDDGDIAVVAGGLSPTIRDRLTGSPPEPPSRARR